MSKRKGIKRHEALQPLSRHHMLGLHTGLKLSRAGTEASRISRDEIKKDAKEFWEPGGNDHLRVEDAIVVPVYAKYSDVNKPEIIVVLLEHVQITKGMTQLLANELTLEEMRALGVMLQGHIRKEEQVIFPMIEAA